MIRLVRVVLSASITAFNSAMERARAAFGQFVSAIPAGVGIASLALMGLQAALNLIQSAINSVTNVARTLFDTFLQGAISQERFTATLSYLTESEQQAAEMTQWLRDESTRLGLDFDGLTQSAQQVAVALRAQNGEVDVGTWQELTTQVAAFAALRPDVPIQFWGRAISAFLAGDPATLTRLLDVNVRDIATLSEETKQFLQGAEAATEQQLGRVTRLGEGAAGAGGNALDALRDVANAVGATSDLLEQQANTTQGKINRLEALWEDFTKRLGEELLPILNDAMDKLLAFIDTHQEDISKFIETLGGVALEGWEKLQDILENIDWEEIGNFAIDSWRELRTILRDIDWESIVEAVNSIANAINSIANSPAAEWLSQTFGEGGLLAGGPGATTERLFGDMPTAVDAAQNLSRTGAVQSIYGALNNLAETPVGARIADNTQLQDALLMLVERGFGLDVTITVDEEGQLAVRNIAKREGARAANETVGSLVGSATRKKGGG